MIVGRLTLANIVRGAFDSGELGYWLDSDLEGRGVMTRAVGAVLRTAREDLGLHRVQAGTLLHNVGSQTVLQRNGFERIESRGATCGSPGSGRTTSSSRRFSRAARSSLRRLRSSRVSGAGLLPALRAGGTRP